MTPEQMQAIAEREYPSIGDTGEITARTMYQRKAFLNGLTYSKWVAVEDGLPEESSYNLVTADDHVWSAFYNGFNFYYDQEGEEVSIPNVTAWQPLPEPYKK